MSSPCIGYVCIDYRTMLSAQAVSLCESMPENGSEFEERCTQKAESDLRLALAPRGLSRCCAGNHRLASLDLR